MEYWFAGKVASSDKSNKSKKSEKDEKNPYDADGIGTAVASLRADRAGGGNGRMYYIDFIGYGGGKRCYGRVEAGVPAKKKKPAEGDGALTE